MVRWLTAIQAATNICETPQFGASLLRIAEVCDNFNASSTASTPYFLTPI
jgi:hypothetical protein